MNHKLFQTAHIYIYIYIYTHTVRKSMSSTRFTVFQITGSTALLAEHISVTFNTMSGLARRSIVHTCGCILELPTSYLSYPEFEKEFDCILSDGEYT